MAAPHVTGVAALIKSIRPDLSAVEIKNIILNNVDKVTALNGKCVTGGRLNAYKAVRAATEPQTFAGDVNGDGRADIILSRGVNGQRALTVYLGQSDGSFSEPVTKQSTRTFVYTDPAFVGDFNGDGRTDLLVHWVYNGYRQLLIYTGRSNGSFHEAVNLSSTRIHNEQSYPCSLHVGDVNGDGKDDFIVHYRSSNGYRRALVYKGSAASPYIEDASSTALTSTNLYGFNTPVFVGDFNGDGRSDMLVHWSYDGYRQLLIYTGKSDGSFNSGVNTSSGHAHNPSDHPCQFFVDDVNADGKDDFIVHWKSQNGYRRNLVYKGKSASNYITEGVSSITSYTCPYVYDEDVLLGDVNGDDYIDMIVQRANSSGKREFLIFSANSDGTYNNDVTLTTNNTHDPTVYAGRALTADVNGDGKDDFIVKWMYNAQWNRFLTYKGTASSPYLLSTPVSTSPSTNVYYYNADSN